MNNREPNRQFCFAVQFNQQSIREDPGQLRAAVHGCLRMHWDDFQDLTNDAVRDRLTMLMGFEVPMQLVALQRGIIQTQKDSQQAIMQRRAGARGQSGRPAN